MKKQLLLFLLIVAAFQSGYASFTYNGWRWRNDDGTETTATWKAAENTPIEISDLSSPIRLRFAMAYDFNDSYSAFLYYTESGTSQEVQISSNIANAFVIVPSDNPNVVDGMATTKQIIGVPTYNAYPFVPGILRSSVATVPYTPTQGMKTEMEFVIKPTANIKAGKTYTFQFGYYGAGQKPYLTTPGTLPVKLMEFSASLNKAGLLKADWKTAAEKDNSHFILQSSVDGKEWKDLVRKSAAVNGANGASYSVETSVGTIALAGFGLLGILLLPFSNRRYRMIAVFAALVLFAASCAKDGSLDQLKLDGAKSNINGSLYLRLAQVDLDGTVTYSNPILVKAT